MRSRCCKEKNAKSGAKRAKRKEKLRQKRLKRTARFLRNRPPSSEVWFQKLWKKCRMNCEHEFFNVIRYGYIPDVVNDRHKYIIEIDGSIHALDKVIEKDAKKTKAFVARGYTVLRVRAYNKESFFRVVQEVKRLRKLCPPSKKDQ